MSYVYRKHEPGLYTVGYFEPNGDWETESRHETKAPALARMRWLNGACGPEPGTGQDAGGCRCAGSAVTS